MYVYVGWWLLFFVRLLPTSHGRTFFHPTRFHCPVNSCVRLVLSLVPRRRPPGSESIVRYRRKWPDGTRNPGPEEIVLDENSITHEIGLPEAQYLHVGVMRISADQSLLAFTVDTTGQETYSLHFKDLTTGNVLGKACVFGYCVCVERWQIPTFLESCQWDTCSVGEHDLIICGSLQLVGPFRALISLMLRQLRRSCLRTRKLLFDALFIAHHMLTDR